jgi:hypothetical protein
LAAVPVALVIGAVLKGKKPKPSKPVRTKGDPIAPPE